MKTKTKPKRKIVKKVMVPSASELMNAIAVIDEHGNMNVPVHLSKAEYKSCLKEVKNGKISREDFNRLLVFRNLRLAAKYAGLARIKGMDFGDVLAECVCGMINAAEKFDPDRGWAFSTYATVSLKNVIRRLYNVMQKDVKSDVYCRNYRSIRGQIRGSKGSALKVLSMFSNKDGEGQIIDVPDDRRKPAYEVDVLIALKDAMTSLTERELNIIRDRYFTGKTLDEVGQEYGICKERVRQIETAARQRLLKAMGPIGDYHVHKILRVKADRPAILSDGI